MCISVLFLIFPFFWDLNDWFNKFIDIYDNIKFTTKLVVKIVKYIEVDDFMWDEFDGCVGMHRMSNYDKTLLTMIPVYGDRMFKHMRWTDTKGFDTDPENIARKKISHVDQRRGFGRNDVNKKEYKTTKAKDITEMVDKYIK